MRRSGAYLPASAMITNLARGPSSPVHEAVIMSVIIDHTVPSASSVRLALGLVSVPTGVAGAGWVRLAWRVD